ncbi:MAG: response regulator transcription factor [Acetatifactor sp.]|nr:response regulator transcription factor [Acetatifactor sp.]
MKILIVEDDRALNNGIALSLCNAETEIIQAYDIREARGLLNQAVSLILLDVGLPDGSGLDFCREIRRRMDEESRVAIIFLTANDMEFDIVAGLDAGADDYITKPFSLAVLRARIDAVLRRRREPDGTVEGGIFEQDSFLFDFDRMCFYVDGETVSLSRTEQRLLKLLVCNQGVTLTRDRLLEWVWPDGAEYVEENALSVTMRRLRQKLPGAPIRTVYGIGYVWERKE